MNNRAIVISVAVGAVLLIWAAFFMPSSKERAPERRAPSMQAQPERSIDAATPELSPAPKAVAPAERSPEAAPSGPAAAAPRVPHAEQRPEKMGPFEELQANYTRDVRDPQAGATEERIRKLLEQPDIPEGMVREVSCVKSVCKLSLRYGKDDREAYMVLMMALVSTISQKLAAAPTGADEGQPVHPIEVYVSRLEPPVRPTPAEP